MQMWNRDSNAARNIRIVGTEFLLHGSRPLPFKHETKRQKVPPSVKQRRRPRKKRQCRDAEAKNISSNAETR